MSKFFSKLTGILMAMAISAAPVAEGRQLHYWFDGNVESVTEADASATKLDCSQLAPGFHTVSFFIVDEGNIVTMPETRWFHKEVMAGDRQEIVFDILVDGQYHTTLRSPYAVTADLKADMFGLTAGDHVISLFATLPGGLTTPMVEDGFYHGGVSETGSVELSFVDRDGADVTDNVSVTWRDLSGSVLGSGSKLSGIAEGDTVTYSFTLPESLGTVYREERRVPVVGSSSVAEIRHNLKPFASVEVSGTVTSDNAALEGAVITVIQYPNDHYNIETSVVTDAAGRFAVDLIDVPSRFKSTHKGYIEKNTLVEDWGEETTAALDIEMESVGAKTIAPEITFRRATANGPEDGVYASSGAADIVYSVYRSDGTEISAGMFEGSIALPIDIEAGALITVKIASASGAFDETEATAVVSENDVTPLSMTVFEAGGLKASCINEYGDGVFVAWLFNADTGAFVASSSYTDGTASFSPLADGRYTLVSISGKAGIGVPGSVHDLGALGLVVGNDYVSEDVTVNHGYITTIAVGPIPECDGSSVSSLASGSRFYANKTQAVADEFITGTISLGVTEEAVAAASGAVLTISMPDACVFEDGSLIIDGKTAVTVSDGNRISVRLTPEQLASRLKFSVRSSEAGLCRFSALLTLAMPGNPTCPVGEMVVDVHDYDVTVPARSARTDIAFQGSAAPFGSVDIFDGETVIGSADVDGMGRWRTVAELHNPVNLSKHNIWIRASRNDGFVYRSQPRECVYDKDYITPLKVTMVNTAHPAADLSPKEFSTVFPFDGSPKPQRNYYYWPQYPDFTFLIDFTRNDPEVISAVELIVFTEDGGHVTLPTSFDASRQCWVASYAFPQNSLPVNVDVDYVADTELEFDNDEKVLTDSYDEFREINSRYDKIVELLNAANESLEQDDENQAWALVSQVLRMSEISDNTTLDSNPEYQELLQKLDSATDVDVISLLLEDVDRIIGESFNSHASIDIEALEKEMAMADSPDVKMSVSIPGVVNLNITSPGQASKFLKTTSNSRALTPSFQILNQAQLDYGMTSQVYVRLSDGTVIDFDISQIDEIREQYSPNSGQPTNSWINTLTQRIRDNYGRALFGMTTNGASMAHTHFEYAENIKSCEAGIKDIDDEIAVRKKSNKFYLTQDHPIFKEWRKNNIDEIIQLSVERNVISKFLARAKLMSRALRGVSFLGLVPDIWNLGTNLNNNFTLQTNNYERYSQLIDYAKKYCNPNSYTFQLEQLRERHMNTLYLWMGFTVFFDITTIVGDLIPPPVGLAVSLPAAHISEWSKAHTSKRDGEFVQERSGLTKKMLSDPNCQPLPPPGGGGNGGGGSAGGGRRPRNPNNDTPPIMDPSGIVYEGVVSMPVEGVTATIYHNTTTEGDGTVWNAEDYSQVNPQITDEAGRYQWDVPRGNWRVVFEKEGYEKAMTEWLPVPPPQLDVNVGLRKTGPAALRNALAFADEVTAEFDTYMDMASLTESSVSIFGADEHPIAATVTALNGEQGADGLTIASKISIRPEAPIADSRVTLVIRPSASTYAGVALTAEIRVTITVEPRITALTAPATFNLGYDSEGTLRVKAEPAAAAAGRKLSVLSGATIMYTLPAGADATFDANGYAELTLAGAIPGNAPLIVGIEGSDLTAETRVVISTQGESDGPAMPEASVTPGRVMRGTAVYLSCATSGATVYYTTDGSCPCDPASTRRVYDGSAIVIDHDIEIRAMAVAEDGRESDIAVFAYTVEPGVTGIEVNGVDAVKAYPVPTRGNLTIEAPGFARMDITVANMAGALVMHHQAEGASAVIDMSPLPAGTYLLTVSDGEGRRHSVRVVRQ